MKIEPMSTVQFYTRYDQIAPEITAFHAKAPDMSTAKMEVEQDKINDEMNALFASRGLGRQVNLMA